MSCRVGIIGGGQLGMMLTMALRNYGAYVVALDPNPRCSCSYVCDEVIVGAYDDLTALQKLGEKCDVITYEFENVPAMQLKYLKENFNIKQGIEPLFDSQNRIREKENARKHGLVPPKFYPVRNKGDLDKGIKILGYPCVYKTTTLGYDGHGQVIIQNESDLNKVSPFLDKEGILEEFVLYDYEASIIMVRDANKTICFPTSYNIHKNGILDLSIAGIIDKQIEDKLVKQSVEFMASCNYYGILAIEYFVRGKDVFFNEMAPRPHNSGHYTIEGCDISQYDALARFLLDLPLQEPKLLGPTVMKNILGYDLENVMKCPSGIYHDYRKEEVRPLRKMGHITFSDTNKEQYELMYKKYFA